MTIALYERHFTSLKRKCIGHFEYCFRMLICRFYENKSMEKYNTNDINILGSFNLNIIASIINMFTVNDHSNLRAWYAPISV